MKGYFISRLLLAFHLSGLIMMAGTTLMDYFTSRTFWKLANQDTGKAFGLLPIMARYGSFVRTGAIILILSGVALFMLSKDILWQQLWFRIKMILVLMLVLNGLFIGNRRGHQLRNMAYEGMPDFLQQTAGIKADLNRFYIIQLLLFFLIMLLSVIKPGRNGN